MKKVFLFIMVAATMLFTQCKKNEVVTPTGGNTVEISLTLDNNSKINVNPSAGSVAYEEGDVIYVAYNHKYVGCLTHDGNSFVGSITIDGLEPAGEKLHFYSLGNKKPSQELTTGITELTVNIMDQAEELPIISYGESAEVYPSDGNSYSSTLRNWCALVKFEASSSKEPNGLIGQVGVYGMKNMVTVDLTNDSFTSGVVEGSEGIIKLNKVGKSGSEYWAVLLPQETALLTGLYAYSTEGLYGTYTIKGIQSIKPGGLYDGTNGEVAVSLDNERKFSVSADKNVRFAPGNIYYDPELGVENGYLFETNQWDYSVVDVTEHRDIEYDVYHVSYFKWAQKKYSYIPGSLCTGELFCRANYTVGGSGLWFAISKDNINYLKNKENNIGLVNVMDYNAKGLMLLPDDFESTVAFNPGVVNNYSAVQWIVAESKGAVLLPCAGYREVKMSNVFQSSHYAFYWLADLYDSTHPYEFEFSPKDLATFTVVKSMEKKYGLSIRLIKQVVE